MPIEILVGVQVTDDAQYHAYRQQMMPILEAHGGRFVVDVHVAQVLRAPDDAQFNRLFTIRFPDEASMTRFFSSEPYQAAKQAHFVPSVSRTVPLGRYELLP